MFGITSVDRINYFANEPTIVSVFIATTFEKSSIEWLLFNWQELNVTTGHSWHLLVPTFEPIDDDKRRATAVNFNSPLARSISEQYGVSKKSLPAIIFDDLNEENNQHFVSIAGWSEIQLRDFFYDCADIISSRQTTRYSIAAGLWRTEVIGEIFNAAQAKKYGKKLLGAAPMMGSLSRFMSGLG